MSAETDGDRSAALATIADLARRHGLTVTEIAAALGAAAPAGVTAPPRRNLVVRVLGFLGGTFVFAGIGTFIALQWDGMGSGARVLVTLGSGLAAFAMAIALHTDNRFDTAVTGLLLIAAVLEPTGMFVAFDEFGSGGDWRWASLVTFGAVAAQFGLAFRPMRRSTALFFAVAYATVFWGTALDLADADGKLIAIVIGVSLLLLAVRVDRTAYKDVTASWYFFGGIFLLAGLFDAVDRTAFEILFMLAAVGLVYLSAAVRSRMLLFVATMAILAYVGWFTSEHFADSIGWPLALIAFGIFMIGLSALAVRIDRKYVRG
ncbi:MAG TPA: DUF2157 domain-containing protein [Vicinamibacterales bacterium]|nr:DUF2157 domain-containing protein [Vicinamibacterales bacterium]